MITMSELDQIKTTITVSLGLKNRLRDMKGSQSYEDYIGYLIRSRNKIFYDNSIELQKFERKQTVCTFEGYKIVFSYNKYNNSENFIFDISFDLIREPLSGEKISFEEFSKNVLSPLGGQGLIYKVYFELLAKAIQNEIEPLFRHKARFEDSHSWNKEFEMLGLSTRAFTHDVMDKLNDFEKGVELE
ncbi:MAG: hypothetical protein V1659_03650 [Candidatus Woesearchaeota archaeon]